MVSYQSLALAFSWNVLSIITVCVRSCLQSMCSYVFPLNKAISHTSEVGIHTRPKLCHFGRYLMKAKLFCLKFFVPVTGLECSYEKIFIPVTEISVAKSEISVTGPARPLIWTQRYFLQRKEWRGEISETEPARLIGLIWRGPKMNERFLIRPWFRHGSSLQTWLVWCSRPHLLGKLQLFRAVFTTHHGQ